MPDGDFVKLVDWSPDQAKALDRVDTWSAESDEQIFSLTGPAGTGKTTLARRSSGGTAVRYSSVPSPAAPAP